MKIGRFAEKNGLTVYAVRYYINEGLLQPKRVGGQYNFDEECQEDMQLIQNLKTCQFTLREMKHILNVKRISHFNDASSLRFLISVFEEKQKELAQKAADIQSILEDLNKEIAVLSNNAKLKITPVDHSGLPLEFLPLLICPSCGKPLQFNQMSMTANTICEGLLVCDCGYNAEIVDGVLITQKIYNSPDVWYTIDSLLQNFTKEYIELVAESYQMMTSYLSEVDLTQKTILTLGENGAEFVYENIRYLGKDNLYIIYDISVETILLARERFAALGENYKILFIAGYPELLPLADNCIDIFVDDFASFYSLFDGGDTLVEKLSSKFKADLQAIGVCLSFEKDAATLDNILKYYPNATTEMMNFKSMKQNLAANGYDIIDTKTIGSCSDPGCWPQFQDPADTITLDTYYAKRNK
ncbi:MAG: MerR family transcriptional regulator [Firmicutes bacterium]|nr:MerR family transcriptional regulator [Bacillota bacterium]